MLAVVETLLVELKAKTDKYGKQLVAAQKKTTGTTAKMGKDLKNLARTTKKNTSVVAQAFATMTGVVGGQAILGAFKSLKNSAIGLFKTLITDGVAAAQVQEDAINRLNTALKLSGKFTKEASLGFQEFASSLQQATKFGDEAILSNAGLIQSLGNLDQEGLKKATAAAVDLAAALNVDLKTAALLVGKAAAGEVSSFSRFGLIIEKGSDTAETFARALDAINDKFGGAAAAQVNTFSGAYQQLSNTFGDATEEIGFAITKNKEVLTAIKDIESAISDALPTIGAFAKFIVQGLVGTEDPGGDLIDSIEAIRVKIIETKKTIESADKGLLDRFIGANAKEKLVEQQAILASLRKQLGEFSLKKINNDRKEDASIRKKAQVLKEKATEEVEINAKKLEDAQLLAEELILNTQANNEITTEILQSQKDAEFKILDNFRKDDAAGQLKFEAAKAALDEKFRKKQADRGRKAIIAEQIFSKARVNIASATANLIAAVAGSGSKAAFLAQKAAAIAQSIVATNLAAAQALAVFPAPNFGLATLAKIAGGVNTAAIAATAITGLQGGLTSVPGIGNRDQFPALLAPKEKVITGRQNMELDQFLASQKRRGFDAGPTTVQVQITVDPPEFANAIRAEFVEQDRLNISVAG